MIQFNHVNKKFANNDFFIADADFTIDQGEFVFLIGPSGSGKTTLIRMLIREELPSSGKIYFDDYDITRLNRRSVYKLRRQVGTVFQDYKLIPDKNVYENVSFAMEVAGRKNREIKETVPYLLDIVGLSSRAKAFPEQLSGGEKQRVAIARAVANNPRLLIADEPTGNLDPASAWDIVQILSKINNWGTTVIMSTHGTDIVNTLNKRVLQLQEGKLIRDDSKGKYELTDDFEEQFQDAPEDKPETFTEYENEQEEEQTTNKTIKVSMKKEQEEAEESSQSHGIFGRLFAGRKKESATEEEAGEQEDKTKVEHSEEQTEASVEDTAIKEELDVDAEKVLADADNTDIAQLNLRKEIIADLRTAGYEDVEDILSAGPEQLKEELVLDPEEVKIIVNAVANFINTEAEKQKTETTASDFSTEERQEDTEQETKKYDKKEAGKGKEQKGVADSSKKKKQESEKTDNSKKQKQSFETKPQKQQSKPVKNKSKTKENQKQNNVSKTNKKSQGLAQDKQASSETDKHEDEKQEKEQQTSKKKKQGAKKVKLDLTSKN